MQCSMVFVSFSSNSPTRADLSTGQFKAPGVKYVLDSVLRPGDCGYLSDFE